MQIKTDSYGDLEFSENGDALESEVTIRGEKISIEFLGYQHGESDLPEVLALSRFVAAFERALEMNLADSSANSGVAMYLGRILEDAAPEKLKALFDGQTPTTQQLFSRIVPYEIRFDLEEPEGFCTIDAGLGNDLSYYLLCVTMDSEAEVQEVIVES